MLSRRCQVQEDQDFRFCRTTCGFIGFIVSFIFAIVAFILAEEANNELLLYILGSMFLFLTTLFFSCVLYEIKAVYDPYGIYSSLRPLIDFELEQFNAPETEAQSASASRPQPISSFDPQPGPHWVDKSIHDIKYVKEILGMSPEDSDEIMDSDNSDFDVQTLRQMTKHGLFGADKETEVKTRQEYQDIDSLYSTTSESSNVIESISDDSPVKGLSALSLSESRKNTVASAEIQVTENVSAELSKLSLDYAEMAIQDQCFSDSEGKLDEVHALLAETFEEAKSIEYSELESKKEA